MAFDGAAPLWFANRRRERLITRLGVLLAAWRAPEWCEIITDIEERYGFKRTLHFLGQSRSLLDKLHEPQVTRSFKNYLNSGSLSQRTMRCQALFDAIAGKGIIRLANADIVTAEQDSRIDLFIRALTVDGAPCCITIEAKFDALLSKNQLQKYFRETCKHVPDKTMRFFRVVAPTFRDSDRRILSWKANSEWQFMSWKSFLLRLQRSLPDDEEDQEFLKFKRMVWERAYGF